MCYFIDRPVRTFADALTNDAGLYVAFHRHMSERGFLMLPMNLKRNCFSAAHTDDDLDRTLETAEHVLSELSRERTRPGSGNLGTGNALSGIASGAVSEPRAPNASPKDPHLDHADHTRF